MKIAAAALALLCVLSTLAGCATFAQTGSPFDEERCVSSGGTWSAVCAGPGGATSSDAAPRDESAGAPAGR